MPILLKNDFVRVRFLDEPGQDPVYGKITTGPENEDDAIMGGPSSRVLELKIFNEAGELGEKVTNVTKISDQLQKVDQDELPFTIK